jgi:tellurium resistance protein TerD
VAQRWYLKTGDQECGPLTVAEIRGLVAEKRIGPTDKLRKESGQHWIAAEKLKGLFPTVPSDQEDETEDPFVHAGKRALKFLAAATISLGTSLKRPFDRLRERAAQKNREAEIRAGQEAQEAKIRADIAAEIARRGPPAAPDSRVLPRPFRTAGAVDVPVNAAVRKDPDAPVRCARCGSAQLSANKKGFSSKKAAVGCLLLGGVGLAGGLIGSNKIQITCLSCGEVFEPGHGI